MATTELEGAVKGPYWLSLHRFEAPIPTGFKGVYVCFSGAGMLGSVLSGNPNGIPVYVGSSQDLDSRAGGDIRHHHRYQDFVSAGVSRVGYLPCATVEDVRWAEWDIYERYKPSLNKVAPPKPILLNALADYAAKPESTWSNALAGMAPPKSEPHEALVNAIMKYSR